MIQVQESETVCIDIFIGGSYDAAVEVCREVCASGGLCVTVERVEFVYQHGAESGVRVGLINYPRFPASAEDLHTQALRLAHTLLERLYQRSFSIVGQGSTVWYSKEVKP